MEGHLKHIHMGVVFFQLEIILVLAVVLFLLFAFALFGGLAFFFIRRHKKNTAVITEEWAKSALELGLIVKEDRKKAIHLMDGVYKGMPVELGIAYRVMGEMSYYYTYCRVPFNPPLGLGLKMDNYLISGGKVKDMLGMQRAIVTGSQEFDSKFSVTATDSQKAQAILTKASSTGENLASNIANALTGLETILIDDNSFYTEIRKSLYGEQQLHQLLDWSVYVAGNMDSARRY